MKEPAIDWVTLMNEFPKENCWLCSREFSSTLLNALSKTRQERVCQSCALAAMKKNYHFALIEPE